MEWLTVATFNEPEEAQPSLERLLRAGFEAKIHDERNLQKWYFLALPLAGIRLRVPKEKQPAARGFLEELDVREGVLRNAIHCPECRSSRIEYPQFSRHFLWGGIAAVAAALGCFQRKFFCKDCQFTWPVVIKLQSKTDTLGWPEKPPHPQRR